MIKVVLLIILVSSITIIGCDQQPKDRGNVLQITNDGKNVTYKIVRDPEIEQKK